MVPTYNVRALDTTAAGDAFTAALALAYCESGCTDILTAVKFANAVGALTVTKIGASKSLPTREEVAAFLCEQGRS
jgi:ribokinase